ncbi:hypothetical protein N7481_001630 [Penicillium waksmanii]|uniref:uncharacterized protein n=1 Tax=Penicillium waksmanii TaxID=69791 RepID=UPI002546F924|nr:uncharacterized protein N7481_001630 [Penicillium waksmanii]KAJ6001221.1 hypothetical protein N7481_001630 [Penicillium waksmanii]
MEAISIYIQGYTQLSQVILNHNSIFISMTRHVFTEQEVRLAAERRLKYIGAAKVSIRQIQFEPPLTRDLDPKNLDRLRNLFRKNRCRRLDVQNHVPATVSRRDLADALTVQ